MPESLRSEAGRKERPEEVRRSFSIVHVARPDMTGSTGFGRFTTLFLPYLFRTLLPLDRPFGSLGLRRRRFGRTVSTVVPLHGRRFLQERTTAV